ncbi:MAG: peptide-methionine (S)-S-oxide reductase MsrA [Rectinemataceae bacterium]
MKYKGPGLAVLAAAGIFLTFASCAGKVDAQEAQPTPSELLPAPSRSLPKENSMTKTPAPPPPWSASPPFASNDFARPLPLSGDEGLEYAVLAGGCFWCLEAVYENIPGVVDVVSGYIGGDPPRPTYEYVSTGASGHAEAVRIAFKPAEVSYDELLQYFWKIHNPTTKDRQGADIGSQYRSAIYYTSYAQRAAALASIEKQKPWWPAPIVTELEPAGDFWIAEEYHQDFYRRNPNYGYCAVAIAPKLKKAGFRD